MKYLIERMEVRGAVTVSPKSMTYSGVLHRMSADEMPRQWKHKSPFYLVTPDHGSVLMRLQSYDLGKDKKITHSIWRGKHEGKAVKLRIDGSWK